MFCLNTLQERKNWLPDPPKPRKRRKNKKTDGQVVKGIVKPTLDRSISDPGGKICGESGASCGPSSLASSSDSNKDTTDSQCCSSSQADSGISQTLDDEMEAGSQGSTEEEAVIAGKSTLRDDCAKSWRSPTLATSKPELLCNFCLEREKNAGIIHGGIIHQICCYPCAKRLYKKRQPCPMCRRRIEKISKIIVGWFWVLWKCDTKHVRFILCCREK